jgi:hypothetical protein
MNQFISNSTDSAEGRFSTNSTPNKAAIISSSSSRKGGRPVFYHGSDPLSLKGVVPLETGRYRVQLNAFRQEKQKFSRNSASLMEVIYNLLSHLSSTLYSFCLS